VNNQMRTVTRLAVLVVALGGAACQSLPAGISSSPQTGPEPLATATAPAAAASNAATDAPTQPNPTATLTTEPTLTPSPSPTRTPIPCTETEGEVIQESFISQITGREFGYRVYLPPCYGATERRYPTLYMLHGLGTGMDDTQWDRMGLDEAASQGYAQGAIGPMIIVMPNGTDADHYSNAANAPFPEVVVKELIPTIDEQYCTWTTRETRAIGGLSRGGFWAYYIAFSHPELFLRVGGHSAYFFKPEAASDKNPLNIVDTAKGIEDLILYLDHGPRDYEQVEWGMEDLMDHLAARGMEATYIVNDAGDHSEAYWSTHVGDYLRFYAEDWPHDVEELPTCHEASPTD
jgi:enterochelin esterase-like enzyme